MIEARTRIRLGGSGPEAIQLQMHSEREMTQHLFEKYYYSKPGYTGGTRPFHELCASRIRSGSQILEIGAGPSNPTTEVLSQIGAVTGADIDRAVLSNEFCGDAVVFDGLQLPYPDNSFDACVSNWVLEHVENPDAHFREVARVLRPGGLYCFRTPNLYHYVTLGARLTAHSIHLMIANKLRGLSPEAPDPYPTYYRANTRRRLRQLIEQANLRIALLDMVEPEPSYGRMHPALFYPMMMYERAVNSSSVFSDFRITILASCTKSRLNSEAG